MFNRKDIEEIPIKEWLTYYRLDDLYYTLFVKGYYETIGGAHQEGKYSHLLTSIKTNVDLLFSFNNKNHFLEAFSIPIHEISRTDKRQPPIEDRLLKGFELLLSQKIEYKAMLSVFGINPSKQQYESIIDSELAFLDSKIIDKLKVLSFYELLECNQTTLNLLLSLPIVEIKKYMVFTSITSYKIVHGLNSSFNKLEFDTFIDTNKNLETFVASLNQTNNYKLPYIKEQLKLKFNAKSLLYSHYTDLLEYFFKKIDLLDSDITDKIYNTLFPDNDHKYIDKQFSRIGETIPKTILTDSYMKQNKMRVFLIVGHGATCSIEDYKKKNRVDFKKVFSNIKAEQTSPKIPYNSKSFNIISTQPVGRFAIPIIHIFNKIFGYKHRNTFLQGLVNSNNPEHLQLLDYLVTIYWNYYTIKNKWASHYPSDKKLSKHLKKSRLKSYQEDFKKSVWQFKKIFKYPEYETTTSDVVNFVKYGSEYPPINTQFIFEPNPNEQLLGIFELNEDNSSDLFKLNNKIKSTIDGKSPDSHLKLGLKLNEVYESRTDIPVRADEILKYNKALPSKESNMYTLEELMEQIYLVGDIKEDEHVVIFDNACRGISSSIRDSRLAVRTYNSHSSLVPEEQSKLRILRAHSMEQSINSVNNTKRRSSNTKRKASTKRRSSNSKSKSTNTKGKNTKKNSKK